MYKPIIHYLDEIDTKQSRKILDFGCGDGIFIKCMIDNNLKGELFGSDISLSMINLAREKLDYDKVELFLADGFQMPVNSNVKFDVIHVDMILHHLIGKTRKASKKLVNKMLDILMNMLSENGTLIIEEHISTSFLIPSFGSFVAFYGLKFLNFFHLDVNKIVDEIQPGLEVNFFHEKQLVKILEQYGTVKRIRKETSTPTKFRRLFLVKEIGTMSFAVKHK